MEQLSFRAQHAYDTRQTGITVPLKLFYAGNEVEFEAKVDTGASHCIFARLLADHLGVAVERGVAERFPTAAGSFKAYGHSTRIAVLGIETDSIVYFAEDYAYNRNVLGRQGWLDRIRLGLVDYAGKLYLSDYNDPAA